MLSPLGFLGTGRMRALEFLYSTHCDRRPKRLKELAREVTSIALDDAKASHREQDETKEWS